MSARKRTTIARLLRSLVAILGLGLFGLSVAQLLWPVSSSPGPRVAHTRPADDVFKDGGEESPASTEGDSKEKAPIPPADSGELVVVLDPGHGGTDPGSVREGHYEKDINLAIAKRVRARVEKAGVKVVMTRATDRALELEERVAVANRYRNSIFVSIHQNASLETSASGVETYFSWPRPASVLRMQREHYAIPSEYAFEDERGQKLAAKVQETFCAATKALSRGTKNRNFVVIRWVHGPAILVECGFLSNPKERASLLSEAYRDKIADGIAEGLLGYVSESGGDMRFGLRFPNGNPPERPGTRGAALVQAQPGDS